MTLELYNLQDDHREETDVAARHPDIIAQIEAIMRREHLPASIELFKFKALGDKERVLVSVHLCRPFRARDCWPA